MLILNSINALPSLFRKNPAVRHLQCRTLIGGFVICSFTAEKSTTDEGLPDCSEKLPRHSVELVTESRTAADTWTGR